jgi:hypothetical protein
VTNNNLSDVLLTGLIFPESDWQAPSHEMVGLCDRLVKYRVTRASSDSAKKLYDYMTLANINMTKVCINMA